MKLYLYDPENAQMTPVTHINGIHVDVLEQCKIMPALQMFECELYAIQQVPGVGNFVGDNSSIALFVVPDEAEVSFTAPAAKGVN